ncbi:MAG: DHA2 family efflux MFS transporter permease subunit [Chlorogloea purpurea SAG 13.99]|jgi:DHA2 family multidrug resistance protein|nr:DHA2 family efflux MFS transporter permease subunit [Chlorogloea purpurea SAG 13.99]
MTSTSTVPEYVTGPLKWGIAITAALGAILEVIDTSIVNVALTDIQASLGATISEVGWVVTGYAIANVVLIPLSAWLGDYFGRKAYFIFSLVGFTIASILCGFAVNLPMLVISRIIQGLCGGGLLAKAQSILFETFPPSEQGVAQAVFGVGVIAGPAIGPTLGGYLTDGLGWRWIFFINLPFGILAVAMAWFFLPKDKKQGLKNAVDWWGIILLTLSVGSLQTVLEEGEKDDWFSSGFIVSLSIISVVGLILFVWWELRVKHPAVELRTLRYQSLWAGSIYSGILGMGLYGTLFVVPIFAQTILGFSATQTGLLLAPGALSSAVVMIILGKIAGRFDVRFIISLGVAGTVAVMWQLSNLTPQSGTEDLFWPLLWRGGVTVMMFLPLSLATLGGLPKSEISNGSGFYNLTRQLGGSFGIAFLTTVLQQREAFHLAILAAKITNYDSVTQERIYGLTQLFISKGSDPTTAHQQALAAIQQTIYTQAAVLSFADIFRIVGVIFICSLPLLFFLSKGNAAAKGAPAH